VGLLDRIKPPPLLRSGPLLLLPFGTSPDAVDALVARWAPLRASKGENWKLAEGLRWIGPIEVTMVDATEFDLPGGYPIAYVAQAKRSRGDGLADRLMDKAIARSVAKRSAAIDDFLMSEGGLTREQLERSQADYDARMARDYPHGQPDGPELDAWHLVCGLARRLGGTCRLADGHFFLPELDEPDGEATLNASQLLGADEVTTLLGPHLGALAPAKPDPLPDGLLGVDVVDDDEWSLETADGETSVTASVWELDLAYRSVLEPLALFDRDANLTVQYEILGPDGAQDLVLRACALVAARTGGLVLDDEGFVVELPPV
jgi:hypothetical protein